MGKKRLGPVFGQTCHANVKHKILVPYHDSNGIYVFIETEFVVCGFMLGRIF